MSLHHIKAKIDRTKNSEVAADLLDHPKVKTCSLPSADHDGEEFVLLGLTSTEVKYLEQLQKISGVEGFKLPTSKV